jgi:hypothetical protein
MARGTSVNSRTVGAARMESRRIPVATSTSASRPVHWSDWLGAHGVLSALRSHIKFYLIEVKSNCEPFRSNLRLKVCLFPLDEYLSPSTGVCNESDRLLFHAYAASLEASCSS